MKKIMLNSTRRLSFNDIGSGIPIIFIHSYLWDKSMWNLQINELKKSFRCISIDLYGHGDSDCIENSITLNEIAKDICELIDKLGIDKYIYIGISIGGMLAPYINTYHCDKMIKTIIMDSYSGCEKKKIKDYYISLINKIETLGYINSELADIIAPIFFSKNIKMSNPILINDFKDKLFKIDQKKIKTICKIGRSIFTREDSLHLLEKFKNPVYFLVGEEDIPRPVYESKEMKNYISNSKLFIIKNAGHISNIENSDEVNKVFNEILLEK